MELSTGRQAIAKAKRVVVKIGTAALTQETGRFHREHFQALAAELAQLAQNRELIVVSSGAIALGMERLGLSARPKDIPGKQACAAVGQSRLVQAYEDALGAHGRLVAQVLLTHDDVQVRRRYLNARHALERLLEERVVPIINENDTVSVDELKFGDNDTLAGLVAGLVSADALVILSDVPALYSADPRSNPDAELIAEVPEVTAPILALAQGSQSGMGMGGMASKVRAAARATELGTWCVIAEGKPATLRAVMDGRSHGTLFHAKTTRRQARAGWIAHALRPQGVLHVDEGARKALMESKKSLLPSGIRRVEGDFEKGDPVDLSAELGGVFARGLAAYGAAELRLIAGRQTSEIEDVLGYRYLDEAVHRDDLALM